MLNKIRLFLKHNLLEFLFFLFLSVFSAWLMLGSFSQSNDELKISTKAWSDFAGHIPLIRSFSFGSNFPPEYPLFPGEPIKYHFLFYAFVGLLEKIGFPIGLALNIPSILGFVFLLVMIYFLAKLIFKSRTIGILSVIFFLFNSSLSFLYYFKDKPISFSSLKQIPQISNFLSFAPYGDGIITAFWNLNIYTNQRHLAISLALSLLIIYLLIRPLFEKNELGIKWHILLGVVLGLSFFLHTTVLLMSGIIILTLAILFSKIRKKSLLLLIVAGITAVPQFIYLRGSGGFSPQIVIGYLISGNFTIRKIVEFWSYNLGISIILISLGFLLANKIQKRILLSFFSLFLIGNLIQFSPEIAANHKFFNYFLLIGNMFSAYALIVLWKKNHLLKPIVIIMAFLMIFGGIIDIFPIYNDHKISIDDYRKNKDAEWILNNTSPDAVFLNTTYLYDPASLAGRKIFLGWPYFAWSQGYKMEKRGTILKNILGAKDKLTACRLLRRNNIDYLEIKIQNPPDPNIPLISNLYDKKFIKEYKNSLSNYSIYNVDLNCLSNAN